MQQTFPRQYTDRMMNETRVCVFDMLQYLRAYKCTQTAPITVLLLALLKMSMVLLLLFRLGVFKALYKL